MLMIDTPVTCAVERASRSLMLCLVLLFAQPAVASPCVGDCDGNGSVSVGELVTGVDIALGLLPLQACPSFAIDGRGVDIDALISAIGFALNGCPIAPTPSTAATPTAAPTETATQPASPCAGTPVAEPPASSACVPRPGAFTDCFSTSGLDLGDFADGQNGAAVADVDGDGFPDVFLWNTANGARLFRNLGHDMQFETRADSGLVWTGPTTVRVAAFGDLDNDGAPDLIAFVDKTDFASHCDPSPNGMVSALRVFRNLGQGTFEDVTDAWGFAQMIGEDADKPYDPGLSLADLNLDGRLDVVEYRLGTDARPLVFLSQPDGTTWKEAGINVFGDAHGPTWSIFFTDANHDQLPDVFVLNDYWETAPSEYYVRVDRSLSYDRRYLPPVFDTAAYSSPMGAATADLNGDGELDMVVTDGGAQHVFSMSSDVAAAWGVAQDPSRFGLLQNCWSSAVLDFENDGRPDLFFSCAGFRNGGGDPSIAASFALRNGGGGTFTLADEVLPTPDLPTWDEGLAVADFDQDGRVDLLTGGNGAAPRLLWNQIPGGGAVAIRLKGKHVNAQGIGARVEVRAPGLPTQVREMFPGGATWGYSDAQLVFGLGQASQAHVTVDWRPAGGGAVQTLDVPPGAVVIEEP
jgi:hypothetical protein